MKNILIVINTMGVAGAERALISLLRSIDYTKCRVSLFSILDRGELFAEVPKNVKVLNKTASAEPVTGRAAKLHIMRLVLGGLIKKGFIFKYLPYALKNIRLQAKTGRFQVDKLLWRLLTDIAPAFEEEYDLAIAYIEGASTYYVADRVKAKKKAMFVHVNYEMAGYHRELDYPYYEKADAIFSVSEPIMNAFSDVYPEFKDKLKLFHNIVNVEETKEKAELSGGYDDDFDGLRLLTIGRLHPQKGLDVAIDAMASLADMGYNNIRWYIIGEGDERERLKGQIQKLGLQDKFILLGTTPNPYPYIKECDIYVQPSRFEGMGIALLEAIILKKPAITTDFDGLPALLENGKNALIISLSKDNLVEAIKSLVDNDELRGILSDGAGKFKYDSESIDEIYELLSDPNHML